MRTLLVVLARVGLQGPVQSVSVIIHSFIQKLLSQAHSQPHSEIYGGVVALGDTSVDCRVDLHILHLAHGAEAGARARAMRRRVDGVKVAATPMQTAQSARRCSGGCGVVSAGAELRIDGPKPPTSLHPNETAYRDSGVV